MRKHIKRMIDKAKTIDELHKVWEYIKLKKMTEDEVLMAWYDLKYNLIRNI
jgi:hypothetical protein